MPPLYPIRNVRVEDTRPFIGVNRATISSFCGCDMTALLVHGRNAYDHALQEATKFESHYEFGGDTLTTEDARKAIERLSFPLVGVETFAVLIGAVDRARGSATDALLKGIEEHDAFVVPILWANSLSEVPKTIRSRCHNVWAKGDEGVSKDVYVRLARNCVSGNYANVIVQLNEIEAKPIEVLFEVGNAMSGFDFSHERVIQLWEKTRLALRQEYTISKNELLGVLCF